LLNRSIKPEPKNELNFKLPEVIKLNLQNGVELLHIRKNNLPIVHLNLISSAGSKFDPNEKKGLSFLTSSLADEGAGEYDSLKLSEELEFLGSSVSISSDSDSMFYGMLSLSENFDRTLGLYRDIIIRPRFEEKDFLREKKKAELRVLQSKDNPGYLASVIFEKLVFGQIPYSLPDIGTEVTIGRILNRDVKMFHETLITPDNSVLIAIGNIDQNVLLDKLNASFSNWNHYPPPIFEMSVPESAKAGIYLVHKKDAAQTELRIGHLSSGRTSSDYFAKMVLNNVLGGQFSSRINLNLRENKGFTYGAHSAFTYNQNASYFIVSAAVNIQNTAESVSEIFYELDRIRRDITDKELRLAKSSIIRKYPSQFETYGQIARNLMNKIIFSLPDNYFDQFAVNVKNVELNDVVKAAVTNILTDKLITLAVGDRDIIKPQLEKLGMGNITELDSDGNQIQ